MSRKALTITAPAKINLGLEILRRRQDGYHDLNTVFAALAFGDTVSLASREDGSITCEVTGSDLPSDERNLAVKAALLLQKRLGQRRGVEITIKKRIPLGAGLGGGSSDAAAVLIGAPIVWGMTSANAGSSSTITLDPRFGPLEELALELGSDVPFFLNGGLAVAGSRGEKLECVKLKLPWVVLLVNPGIHVATAEAFAAVSRSEERKQKDLRAALEIGVSNPASMRAAIVNDFEPAIFALHPELAEIKRQLYEAGAEFALMSGSGSTLYGLFATHTAATIAQASFEHCWTAITTFQ